jgi:hypothetical protein
MRIWSVHPKYLDQKGLVALWRETLLAKKVLEGNTKGYKNHSQLVRFKYMKNPVVQINGYLLHIYEEATARGYNFNRDKIDMVQAIIAEPMLVTQGQFDYESKWLQQKLYDRDPNMFTANEKEGIIEPHPMFRIVGGPIATWEKT